MFAFLILGIVVDDAIVVACCLSLSSKGMSFLQAAIKGARQIALLVTFSIIDRRFHADVFCAGRYGQIFSVIPLVVCSTFLISLIESLFIPAHLGHQSDQNGVVNYMPSRHHLAPAFPILPKKYMVHFRPSLTRSLHNILLGIDDISHDAWIFKSGRIMEMFPDVEADVALCAYTPPYGSPVEDTRSIQDQLLSAGDTAITKIEEEFICQL